MRLILLTGWTSIPQYLKLMMVMVMVMLMMMTYQLLLYCEPPPRRATQDDRRYEAEA